MGRKSLAQERSNQILDAYQACIVEYGLSGATLQRTAERAGVNLGMIHHYIGRRDDLLKQMVARLIKRQREWFQDAIAGAAETKRLERLLYLFFEAEPDDEDRVLEALLAESERMPEVIDLLSEINALYLRIWAEELARYHVNLDETRCEEIALAILALAYGESIVSELKLGSKEAFKRAAETLIYNP